ncbi:MAG: 3-hydroxyacyl-CoA dehydrogenase NAD-binding domain-containing protein [Desulfitobacteriaceae bacterium]|nr:3-hydroxyacyl-CoA dehydrogenase NAD-binding domain-containing protein [Desulfitobacteriaceae bacterium]MDI6879847.1 3-hydroxyacyl-CoA dehydrogenase NAD-binding domain-containing protein [Desulfitobacteriaceae bacterium]MDI6915297.1 3-hydroxyacyl-CoA dehydrogenase NAD-binding domain-containing protein [Desulfitobacteriaceae bacterium]
MLPWFRPQQFFICHYFNPPEIIPVVEIVRSERTEERVVQWVAEAHDRALGESVSHIVAALHAIIILINDNHENIS